MKHYMDHAPSTSLLEPSDDDSDLETTGISLLSTPSKRSRTAPLDQTPRARPVVTINGDRTPIPRIPPPNFGGRQEAATCPSPSSAMLGFTLSYLRRVPELSDMARRVVKAEFKRRMREERKNAKESTHAQSTSHARNATPKDLDREKIAAKKKRLFKWAIIKLLQEGSIVLWDGAVRPCRGDVFGISTSRLWKANSSTSSTLGADSTIFSSTGGITQTQDETGADEDELSDPEVNEESYVPLTPAYLATHVENAIRILTAHSITQWKSGSSASRVQDPRIPVGGPTKDAILSFLRKDDRWRNIGDWNVDEALEFLRKEGRAWCVGCERWELTV